MNLPHPAPSKRAAARPTSKEVAAALDKIENLTRETWEAYADPARGSAWAADKLRELANEAMAIRRRLER